MLLFLACFPELGPSPNDDLDLPGLEHEYPSLEEADTADRELDTDIDIGTDTGTGADTDVGTDTDVVDVDTGVGTVDTGVDTGLESPCDPDNPTLSIMAEIPSGEVMDENLEVIWREAYASSAKYVSCERREDSAWRDCWTIEGELEVRVGDTCCSTAINYITIGPSSPCGVITDEYVVTLTVD